MGDSGQQDVVLSACLLDGNVAYFAGQDVSVEISIKVTGTTERRVKWLCAQICQSEVVSSHSKVKDFAEKIGYSGKSEPVTKPEVIVANATLAPGVAQLWKGQYSIPFDDVIPSFNGSYLKVRHYVHVAAQLDDFPTASLSLPIRVAYLQGLQRALQDSGELGPVNPFVQESRKARAQRTLEVAVDLLETYVFAKDEHVYSVRDGEDTIATLTMPRTSFKVGDAIVGYLSFDRSLSKCCVQVLVILQSLESASGEADKSPGGSPAPKLSSKVLSWTRQHEFTASYTQCAVNLDVPAKATQSFSSDFVNLTWRLHFEFVLSNQGFAELCPSKQRLDGSIVLSSPGEIDVRTLQWNLPLVMYPVNPTRIPPDPRTTQATASVVI